jgi:hypothetical protein
VPKSQRLRPQSEPAKVGGDAMIHPDKNDVVVRQWRGHPDGAYLLGTPVTPDQYSLRTREEAVTQAAAFARKQHVRAWFDNGDDTFILLGTSRDEA